MSNRRKVLPYFTVAFLLMGCGSEAGPTTGTSSDTSAQPSDAQSTADAATYDTAIGDIQTALPDVSIGKQPLAGVCVYDTDCEDGWCNTGYSGGYCSAKCSGASDCPAGSECFPDPESSQKMCWKKCETHWDCRADQFCADGVGICTPDCQIDTCNSGYKCDNITGQCVPIASIDCEPVDEVCDDKDNDCDGVVDEGCGPALDPTEDTLVTDLGYVEAGGGGLSQTLSIDISTAAKSFMIIMTTADGSPDILSLWSLRSPSGEELVIGSDPYGSPIRLSPDIGNCTVLVPNTPSVTLEGGKYKFSIYKDGALGGVWVSVIQVIRPQVTQSKMDVNFWFTGLGSLNANKAKTNNKFKSLLNYFKELLKEHGITVNKVAYYDVANHLAQQYSIVDSSDEFGVDEHAEILALSESLPKDDRGVNFFFVKGFTGWGLLGKAGGIPGPPIHGTYSSGVVVSMADYFDSKFDNAVALTAHAMAHELGHQLGLFHTSEQTGEMWDPLPDTPKCANDFNKDGMVDFQECIGKGNTNLMFWLAHLDNVLSNDQKFVLHRNPTLYE